MLGRVLWRALNVMPDDEPGVGLLQRRIAHTVHLLLYLLLFALMASGYLISTADGRPIEVFGLFAVPALVSNIPNLEEVAGKVHWYLALTLIGLADYGIKYNLGPKSREVELTLSVEGIRQ